MTEARVQRIYEDRVTAREFLEQAEVFMRDARKAGLDAISQAVLLHNATVCACDAILQAAGLRVTAGDRSHTLRIETALDQVDDDTDDLLDRLDASRELRNEASYRAGFVARASVAESHDATSELITLARAVIEA
ncbi:MAG TPA: hypothetical protein VF715_01085 [Thermoleophilaceae bacterium]